MKLFKKMTDGGPLSNSIGYFLCEIKPLFSVVLLRFKGKSREVFHEHAFHCLNWVIRGSIKETLIDGRVYTYTPSFFPFHVGRRDYHQVSPTTDTAWIFSIRGPWKKKWRESTVDGSDHYELTNGRKRVNG